MAQIVNIEVTLTLSAEVANCDKCGLPSRVFIHPGFTCANCWSMRVLKGYVEQLSRLARAPIAS